MMNTSHSQWIDRLSEYLDGNLADEPRRALEDHLAGCSSCRSILADLEDLVVEAGTLGGSSPTRDLWPEIAAAIREPMEAASARPRDDVIELPTARSAPAKRAGMSFSAPQLAAASVVLVVASAAVTWWVGPGVASRGVASPLPPVESQTAFVAELGAPAPELASELEVLEQALEGAWGRLEPNTVRILEKNLGVIERAIEESIGALAVDPENTFLLDHLDRAYREKATYLREAADIAEWIS
jgi:anti-sigma factor RsiW